MFIKDGGGSRSVVKIQNRGSWRVDGVTWRQKERSSNHHCQVVVESCPKQKFWMANCGGVEQVGRSSNVGEAMEDREEIEALIVTNKTLLEIALDTEDDKQLIIWTSQHRTRQTITTAITVSHHIRTHHETIVKKF